jgi:hypothetical protein
VPRKATIQKKTGGFTKQVNLWMDPSTLKAAKHRAVDENVPVQAIVHRALNHYLETVPIEPEPAATT